MTPEVPNPRRVAGVRHYRHPMLHLERPALTANATKAARLLTTAHPHVPQAHFRSVLTLNYCYLACLAIHLVLVAVFTAMGETFLALFNVGSAFLFLGCFYLNAVRGAYRLPVLLGTVEIIIHASICVVTFGWDAGFHYYVLALGVSTFIVPWWPVSGKLALMSVVGLLSVGLSVHASQNPPLSPLSTDVAYACQIANLLILFASLALIGEAVSRSATHAEENLDRERRRADDLLHNILPRAIADRLKSSAAVIADRHASVTILFCDLVGFTRMSESAPAEEVVAMLDRIFSRFDQLADQYGLEKIKTIGDAYMVAGGLPSPSADHAERVGRFALRIRDWIAEIGQESGRQLNVRIGIHTGPVVAGVIGSRKFAYDVWGDTVNTASRMESHGAAGEIQITEATRTQLGREFACEDRGAIEIKGKGLVRTFWLRGAATAAMPAVAGEDGEGTQRDGEERGYGAAV